jgi:hypothetical protein
MTKPLLLQEGEYTPADLQSLKDGNKIWKFVDNYDSQLEELFVIDNPPAKLSDNYQAQLNDFVSSRTGDNKGTWVYFPWSGVLSHILNEEEFFKVRTNRNKNIITAEEQDRLRDFTVGFLGLSIGNGMAVNVAFAGISKRIKIADFDTLELSNLNRIRAGISHLGEKKTDITAQQIYEVNPYAEVELFEQGINKDNINEFINSDPKLGVVFEAIDDFEMKIRSRFAAREAGVPLIMLTNLGDRLMIDVERYDMDGKLPIFNGLIGDAAEEILNNPITEQDKQKYAVAIVGRDNIPQRVMETIGQINKTLVGRPQVISTVTIGSGVAALLSRRIALGNELRSGRILVDFESLINQ